MCAGFSAVRGRKSYFATLHVRLKNCSLFLTRCSAQVKYLQYTFSTLGFAKNASVIKLQPKKASVAATPAERKLMAELDSLKLQLEEMRKLNAQLMASQGDGSMSVEKQVCELLSVHFDGACEFNPCALLSVPHPLGICRRVGSLWNRRSWQKLWQQRPMQRRK